MKKTRGNGFFDYELTRIKRDFFEHRRDRFLTDFTEFFDVARERREKSGFSKALREKRGPAKKAPAAKRFSNTRVNASVWG